MQVRVGGELLDRLLQHVSEVVGGSVGVGVSVVMAKEPPRVVGTVGLAEHLDALQWKLVDGPLVEARRTEQPITSDDLPADSRWPGLAEGLRSSPAAGAVGAVVMPGSWDDAGPVLVSVYLDQPPTEAVVQQVLRLEPLLATALALLEYCSGEVLRADQMLEMMQYRRVIEQSKGLVMAALRCDAEQAFATLTRASQHFNVRLRDLAIAIVEHVGDAPAEQPEDPSKLSKPSPRARGVGETVWTAITHQDIVPPEQRHES